MRKIINNNPYKIASLLVTILFYLLFKDVPYIGIFLNGQVLVVILAIEIVLLFRLKSDTVLKISFFLYVCIIIAAVLGLEILDTLTIGAFFVFIYGWCQSAIELWLNSRKQ